MTISRIVGTVSVTALAVLVATIVEQRPVAGYHELPLVLAGGVPATLYYRDPPGTPASAFPGIDGPVAGSTSHAAVVVAHGFAGDRATMEALSQSLAAAGYTVLSLDLSGHGSNRHPLLPGVPDQLPRDIDAGVRYLHTVDGFAPEKIAVLGHSMGAVAALEYGTREAGSGALIVLGGATRLLGAGTPRNALLLYAESDLPGIEAGVRFVAARYAHVDAVEDRKTYGDFAAGSALRVARIPGVNHGALVTSPAVFAEAVDWLDKATAFPARAARPVFASHPLGGPWLWLSFLLVLPGLGLLLARLAPEPPAAGSSACRSDVALLPVALLLPLPFLAAGRRGVLLGSSMADANVTHLGLAGLLLIVALLLRGRSLLSSARITAAVAVGAAGWVAVAVLFSPVAAHFHGVTLTPEKAWIAAGSALCLAPFALAAQWLAHGGSWWRAALLRVAIRIAVLACVGLGLALAVFGGAGLIAVPALLLALLIVEPVLGGFFGRSRSVVAAATFDALVTGWLFAVALPTVM